MADEDYNNVDDLGNFFLLSSNKFLSMEALICDTDAWKDLNKDENLLTRLQNINLCFHFEVEQQVNGVLSNFFGFNGTAGVWRIKALEESGGWLERTTVEDMDIAVRAHLHEWKFIYLNDVKILKKAHDSFFQAKVARGYDMYECLVDGCGLKFKHYKARHQHLVDKHKFPTTCEFFKKTLPSKKQR